MKPNTHGGARANAGRKRKPDRITCGFRLELDTFERVKNTARQRHISQSTLVNQILSKALKQNGIDSCSRTA